MTFRSRRILPALPLLLLPLESADAGPTRSFPLRTVQQDGANGLQLENDPEAFESLRDLGHVILSDLTLPEGGAVSLNLRRLRVSDARGRLVVDGQVRALSDVADQVQLWRGDVLGEDDSFAFMSFSPYGSRGVVKRNGRSYHLRAARDAGGRFVPGSSLLSGFAADAPMAASACGIREVDQVLEKPASSNVPAANVKVATIYQANIAVETDYQFYQLFGDQDEATAYVLTVLGAASAIYAEQCGTVFNLPYIGIHTHQNDGWDKPDSANSNSVDVLYEFRNAWKNGNAPVAASLYHFMSGADLGGGVAWLNALCSQSYGFGVSGNINGELTVPIMGNAPWDLVVVAHELGHNFYTPHTHDYCPPIDSCAPSGYFGDCQTSQICIPNGTIMSYCHLCSGGLANIDLEFYPTVAANIRAAVESSCLQPAESDDDVCVDQADGVHVEVDPNGDAAAQVELVIADCGNPLTPIDWSLTETPDETWVSVDAASGTTTANGSVVTVSFDATGLAEGEYMTTLHVANDADAEDFVELPVVLRVLPEPIILGDRLMGVLSSAEDEDVARIDGLKGAKVELAIDNTLGGEKIFVVLLDENGDQVEKWSAKSGKVSEEEQKLTGNGIYSLRVYSSGEQGSGTFEIATSEKLPGSAKTKTKKLKAKTGDTFADFSFSAHAGASLDVVAVPNGKFQGTASMMLFDPTESTVDLSAHVSVDGLTLTGVLLEVTGSYVLRVSGFTGAKNSDERVKVTVMPTQPAGDSDVMIE